MFHFLTYSGSATARKMGEITHGSSTVSNEIFRIFFHSVT